MLIKPGLLATALYLAVLGLAVSCASPTATPTNLPPTATATLKPPTETSLPQPTPTARLTIPVLSPTEESSANSASPTPSFTASPSVEPPYDDRSSPVRLLASYYNAINRREYSRAWAYWESPLNPSYEDFVQGFADTESVMLVVRPPTRSEGAAGSVYVTIPALLSATHTDDSRHNFVGCFVARRPNVPEANTQQWSLFDAMVHPSPGNSTDALLLMEACEAYSQP